MQRKQGLIMENEIGASWCHKKSMRTKKKHIQIFFKAIQMIAKVKSSGEIQWYYKRSENTILIRRDKNLSQNL